MCWECGHVGLPRNRERCAEGADAQCGGCGGDAQTNMVKVAQPDGTVVPWIEEAPPPPKKE